MIVIKETSHHCIVVLHCGHCHNSNMVQFFQGERHQPTPNYQTTKLRAAGMALKFDCLFFVEYFAMDLIMSRIPRTIPTAPTAWRSDPEAMMASAWDVWPCSLEARWRSRPDHIRFRKRVGHWGFSYKWIKWWWESMTRLTRFI